MRLEPRRVLNGAPMIPVPPSADPVVVDAGAAANDGQADFFQITQVGNHLEVSVNGKASFSAAAGQSLVIKGSSDADQVEINLSNPSELQSTIDIQGQSGADTVSLDGGTVDEVGYYLAGDGSQSIQIGNNAIEVSAGAVISDQLAATHREFVIDGVSQQVLLTDASGDGLMQIQTSALQTVQFAAPVDSLEIDVRDQSSDHDTVTIQSLDVAFHGNLDVEGDVPDAGVLAGQWNLQSGNLFVNIGEITVTGQVGTTQAIIDLESAASITVAQDAVISNHGGLTTVDAGIGGTLLVAGTIDAQGLQSGELGGTVRLLGDHVGVISGAVVNASGDAGGGTILVGGDYQGKNPDIRNATRTTVLSGAELIASAVHTGQGGKVIVWSDEVTRFAGSIVARGGADGGNGGFAEVSGASLSQQGKYDLGAPLGSSGTLLFDPTDIIIQGGTLDGSDDVDANDNQLINDAGSNTLGSILFADAGAAEPFVIYESEIEGTDANIVLEATKSITVAGAFTAGLVLNANRDLTLTTRNSALDGAGDIDLSGGTGFFIQTSGTGTVAIAASSSGFNTSNVVLSAITTADQNISISTGNGTISVDGQLSAGAGTVDLSATGDITQSAAIVAAALSAASGVGTVDLSLSTNDVTNFSATALTDVSYQDADDVNVGLGGVGITASGTVRLQAATGDITQDEAITAFELGAVATTGNVDLSLSTNDVTEFAAKALAAGKFVNYQDATGFKVSSVSAGGPFAAAVDGIMANVANGTVRLQAGGDITQDEAITAFELGAVAVTGNVDLSLSTNDVTEFAAKALAAGKSVNYQDATGFKVSSVSAGGPFAATVDGIMTNAADGTVRLQAATGDITQDEAITAFELGAVAVTGSVDLSLSTNDVTEFAAKALAAGKFVNYQDATGFKVSSVSAGGPFAAAVDGIMANVANGTVRLQAGGDITQDEAITAFELGAVAVTGNVDLSLSTNDVTEFAAKALAAGKSVNYQDATGFKVSSVSAGGPFAATVDGIMANAADGTVRLQAATGDITQDEAITAFELGAVAVTGSVDLSLSTNDVTEFAAKALAAGKSVNYQDATGFQVSSVSAGGPFAAAVDGIMANVANGTVRLQAGGDITQDEAITAFELGAVAVTGNVDLSLSTNDVTEFAAKALAAGKSVNYQDATGFKVSSVSAGGPFAATVDGIMANAADGTVRLQAATGDITQDEAITAFELGAVAVTGSVDLSLSTNDVTEFAAKALAAGKSVNYQDATGFQVSSVSAGGPFAAAVDGIMANAADGTVRLQAATGDITQDEAITAFELGAVATTGNVDLSLSTNDVTELAAQALAAGKFVNYQDATGFQVSSVSAGGPFAATVDGIMANAADGTVRLQAATGDITQDQAIAAFELGAVAVTGNVDLSLSTNDVTELAAQALAAGKFVNYQDATGFQVSSVSAGGPFAATVDGIMANAADGTVRLQAATGDITQDQAIAAFELGAVAVTGSVDLSLSTNDVTEFAAKALAAGKFVNYQDATGFKVSSVSAGGPFAAAVDGIMANVANGTVRLQAGGDITQDEAITAFELSAVSTATGTGAVDLSGAVNQVVNFAAEADQEVNFLEQDGFQVGQVDGTHVMGDPFENDVMGIGGYTTQVPSPMLTLADYVRLQSAGNITQDEAVDADRLLAVSTAAGTGTVDLSLSSNHVNFVAGRADGAFNLNDVNDANYAKDAGILEVTSVTGSGLISGEAGISGYTTQVPSPMLTLADYVRLQSTGNITQDEAVDADRLLAVSTAGGTGTVDLSLSSNHVNFVAGRADGAFNLNDVNDANYAKDAGILEVTSVTGSGLISGEAGISGYTTQVPSPMLTLADYVRLQSTGNITQDEAVDADRLLAVSTAGGTGTVDLSLSSNHVNFVAGRADGTFNLNDVNDANYAKDAGILKISTVAGTGEAASAFQNSVNGISGYTPDTATEIVRLQALKGDITQDAGGRIYAQQLGAYANEGSVILCMADLDTSDVNSAHDTNEVGKFAAYGVNIGFRNEAKFSLANTVSTDSGMFGGVNLDLHYNTTDPLKTNNLTVIVDRDGFVIDKDLPTTNGTDGAGTIYIQAGGDITQTAKIESHDFAAVSTDDLSRDLSLDPQPSSAGSVILTNANNDVTNFAAKAESANQSVNFRDKDGINVATVSDQVCGLSAVDGISVDSTNGTVRLRADAGDVTQTDNAMTSTTGAAIKGANLGVLAQTGNIELNRKVPVATGLYVNEVATIALQADAADKHVYFGEKDGFTVGEVTASPDNNIFTDVPNSAVPPIGVIANSLSGDVTLATNNGDISLEAEFSLGKHAVQAGTDAGHAATLTAGEATGAAAIGEASIYHTKGDIVAHSVNLYARTNVGDLALYSANANSYLYTDASGVVHTGLYSTGTNDVKWDEILTSDARNALIHVQAAHVTVTKDAAQTKNVGGNVGLQLQSLTAGGTVTVDQVLASKDVVLTTTSPSKPVSDSTLSVEDAYAGQHFLIQTTYDNVMIGKLVSGISDPNSINVDAGSADSDPHATITNLDNFYVHTGAMTLLQLNPDKTYGPYDASSPGGLNEIYTSRPAATTVFDVQSTFLAPNEGGVTRNQWNSITAKIGMAGESGWNVAVNWDDPNGSLPTEQGQNYGNGESSTFQYKYDTISGTGYRNISFIVSLDASISLESSSAHYEVQTLLTHVPEIQQISPRFLFAPTNTPAVQIPPPSPPVVLQVPLSIMQPMDEFQIAEDAAVSVVERRQDFVLQTLSETTGEPVGMDEILTSDILQSDNLIQKLRQLPDGRYRLQLRQSLDDNVLSERTVLDVEIIDGVPTNNAIEELIERIQRQFESQQPAPGVNPPAGDAEGAAVDLPDANGALLTSEVDKSVANSSAESRHAAGSAVVAAVVGAAVSRRAGWEQRVRQLMRTSAPAELTHAARLSRALRRKV